MQITVGTIAIIIASIFIFLANKKNYCNFYVTLFSFYCMLDLFLSIGYAAKVGEQVIDYNMMTEVLLFFASLPVLFQRKASSSSTWFYLACFFVTILIGIVPPLFYSRGVLGVAYQESWDSYFASQEEIHLVFFDAKQFIGMMGRFLLFVANVYAFIKASEIDQIKRFSQIGHICAMVTIVLWCIEFLLDNSGFYSELRHFQQVIFGFADATYEVPRMSMGVYVPLLLLKEPSATAVLFLFLGINEFFRYNLERQSKSLFTAVAMVFFLGISGSMSSLIYVVVLLLVFLGTICRSKKNLVAIFAVSSLVVISAGILLYRDRLGELMAYFSSFRNGIKGLPPTSTLTRMYSIYIAFQTFLKYPFFGAGLGLSYSYSGTFTMLENIGILGMTFWSLFLCSMLKKYHLKQSNLVFGLITLLLIYSFTGHLGMMLYLPYSFMIFLLSSMCNKSERGNLYLRQSKVQAALVAL